MSGVFGWVIILILFLNKKEFLLQKVFLNSQSRQFGASHGLAPSALNEKTRNMTESNLSLFLHGIFFLIFPSHPTNFLAYFNFEADNASTRILTVSNQIIGSFKEQTYQDQFVIVFFEQ